MELVALATALTAAILSLALTPLVRGLALRIGFVDAPGERKIHTAPVAYGGGIAVALAMIAVLAVGVPIVMKHFSFPATGKQLRGDVLVTIAACAGGVLLLGLADDKYKLSPWTKLAVQLALGIATVAGGVRITAFIGDTLVMRAVTVLWIVLITNSFNLLDNMDGLCAGTAAIAAGILSFLALESGQFGLALALAALAGACLGFMKYNRAPATVFLGDAGSLFIGYLMACFTALVTYYHNYQPSRQAIGIPLLILAIPLYDTLSVIWIRIRERRPIMRGDTSHFSHRLVDLGMTRRQAVATIHLACLAIGLPATALRELSEAHGFLIIGHSVLVLAIVALLERAGRNRGAKKPQMNTDEGG